ncbi:MAG: hypothetical protein Q8P20_02140 [bacterium]|nr:hypothetical protein [bacterium]
MKKTLIIVIVIVILLLIGAGVYYYNFSERYDEDTDDYYILSKTERDECLSEGDSIATYSVLSPADYPDVVEFCAPADLGKQCKQESDCKDSCIADFNGGEDYEFDTDGYMIGTCGVVATDCPAGYYLIKEPTKSKTNLVPAGNYCA